jgi:endoglucanase
VAGPWARSLPATIDPSYFAPRAFEALGEASGDPRWAELERGSNEIVAKLTRGPAGLAPDWAQIEAGGTVRPIAAPDGSATMAQFGPDAARVPLWMAQSCEPGDRWLAARPAAFLAQAATGSIAAAYTLEGTSLGGVAGPVGLVSASAASTAAGRRGAAAELLDRAEAEEDASPSYYAAALIALDRVLLESDLAGSC